MQKLTLWGLAIAPVSVWFTEWAQSYPMPAAAALVAWEVALLLVAFGQEVWAKVRPGLVDRTSNAVTFWIDCVLSNYRRRYLRDVVYQHRNLDVKGLSTQATFTLELEQVFVDLSVAPIAPHEASADMLRKLPKELQEGRHPVWDFLQAFGKESSKLVLLGAPGSGKTTLVKHVALTFAHGRAPKRYLKARRNLPILLFLREHAATIAQSPDTKLSDLIAGYMKDKRQIDVPASWFEAQLRRDRCVVMLDGLDEVADSDTRNKVAVWVDQQMRIHGGNRFIITSRPHGYRDNPLNGVNVLDVRPFTSEQVRDFVDRWYIANEIKAQQRDDPGVRQDARAGAQDLLNRLHGSPALSDLAVNPLLLTMIATVHRYRSSLPGRRVELYAEICEVSLGKRQQSKGIQLDLTPAQKQRVLEPLAWAMMVARKREIPTADAGDAIRGTLAKVNQRIDPRAFLTSIENDSSLLLEKEAGGVYAFAHLTFQEYLAACHAQNGQDRIDLLTRNVGDGWWAECIRLFAATGDATPILRVCIDRRPLDPEAIALALQCMEEAERKEPDVERELNRIIESGLDDADAAKRKPIAEALLKRRLALMRRLDEDSYIDPEFITHAEYQLFIDERRAAGEHRRPVHWELDRFPKGQGAEPVVGVSFSDALAFCAWLSDREASWLFDLPSWPLAASVPGDQPVWCREIHGRKHIHPRSAWHLWFGYETFRALEFHYIVEMADFALCRGPHHFVRDFDSIIDLLDNWFEGGGFNTIFREHRTLLGRLERPVDQSRSWQAKLWQVYWRMPRFLRDRFSGPEDAIGIHLLRLMHRLEAMYIGRERSFSGYAFTYEALRLAELAWQLRRGRTCGKVAPVEHIRIAKFRTARI